MSDLTLPALVGVISSVVWEHLLERGFPQLAEMDPERKRVFILMVVVGVSLAAMTASCYGLLPFGCPERVDFFRATGDVIWSVVASQGAHKVFKRSEAE